MGPVDDGQSAVEALFDAALDLPPADRVAFLEARCADRPTIRREVEVLLAYADMATDDVGGLDVASPHWSLRTAALQAGSSARFDPPEWMRAGTTIEQYELIRQLGRGGMSTVFLARDTQLARRVALKFLHRSDDGFEAEARATARCEHPNIVRIYALGAFGGCPFIVLEHIAGESLRSLLVDQTRSGDPPEPTSARRGLPMRQVAELMAPVARALDAAHARGVVHCDLKPENIVIGRDGSPRVLDFGIARLIEGGLAPGALVGTPAYMSPEQLRGEPLDQRTDLWSAGVILFEMLTGRLPFDQLDQQIAAAFALAPPEGLAEAADRLGRLRSLVEACLQPDPTRRPATAAEVAEGLEALLRGSARPTDEAHAFAGLAPIQASDAANFFGRDREIEAIVGRLRREPRLLVIGPSGVGKSSLLRAGVATALQREGWQALIMRPGSEPFEAMVRLLAELDARADALPTADVLRLEPGRLGAILRAAARRRGASILLVVDQFEELYTQGAAAATRQAFLAAMRGAADDPGAPVRVVATLRDDFLHRVLADERPQTDMPNTVFVLGAPDRACLRAALVGPVEAMGYRFDEPALVDELLDGLEACSVPLPLLQFTAQRMWAARDRRRRLVTRSGYAEAGGIEGALAEHADGVFVGLPRAQQPLARRVLERLVTPERTRARVELSELATLDADPTRVEAVVGRLVSARLLTVDGDPDGQKGVELAHESLIARWPRLQSWLSEVDRDTAFEARVRAAAAQWSRAERSSGLLWRARDARDAVHWAQRHRSPADRARLGADGIAYLDAVVRAAGRRRIRQRLIAGGAVLLLLAATVVFAHLRRQAAEEARRATNWARISVARNLEHDPTTMLAVLREVEGEPPPTWSRLVRWALDRNPAQMVLQHPEVVTSAVWAPGLERIATACGDKSIRLWRPDAHAPERTLPAHMVTRLRFDHAGQRLVSAGKDGTVRIWDVDGDTPPTVMTHPATVYQAVFDADDQRLATASFDGNARIWDADGRVVTTLDHGVLPHGGPTRVYGVAFVGGGQRLATAAWDGRLRLWSARSGELLTTVDAHGGKPVASLDVSADGRMATGGFDDHVRLWSPDGTPVLGVGLESPVNVVRFDSARDRIIAGCADGTVWGIDITSGARARIGHHTGQVHGLDVAPDGTVLSASFDGSVRQWPVPAAPRWRRLLRHTEAVVAVAISPDGEALVTIGEDKTLRVGPLDDSSPARTLYTGKGRLSALALHPGGEEVVVADADAGRGIVRTRLDGVGSPSLTPLPETWLSGLTFTADGHLAASDIAGQVWSWPSATAAPPRLVGQHPDRALAIAADRRNRFLASGGADESVRLWPIEPAFEALRLGGHPSKVTAVAVDPDGLRVAAGTLRGTWLWSVDARPPTRRVLVQESEVEAVAFGPRGASVATVAQDRTLRIWPVAGGEPVVIHADSPLTALAFTPDGQSVVAGAQDGSVQVFRDLAPVDQEGLWRMTYCLSVAKRRELLGVTLGDAEDGHERCLQRVRAVRRRL